MAEFPNFLDPNSLYQTATSQGYGYWISLGMQLIVSTIIGGILLMVILEAFSKKFGENIKPANAFLVVLIANVINYFGVMGILVSVVPGIAGISLIMPVLVWIVLVKAFFGQMKFVHAVAVGVAFYLLTLIILPTLVGSAAALLPSFG
jgi:hypothetical protein